MIWLIVNRTSHFVCPNLNAPKKCSIVWLFEASLWLVTSLSKSLVSDWPKSNINQKIRSAIHNNNNNDNNISNNHLFERKDLISNRFCQQTGKVMENTFIMGLALHYHLYQESII